MIAFITSVRHPKNSTNYNKVELLLERTLKSVCGQTDENYCVIVVCNEIPTSISYSSRVHFVKVDFPPPSIKQEAKTELSAVLKDKGTKYLVGLLKAKEFDPDYIMFFDADDLVHNGISDYVNSNLGENGWFIKDGLVYRDGGLLISEITNFNQVCGTSNILKFDLICPPNNLSITSTQEMILDAIDNDFLFKILGGHRHTETWFKEKGNPLKPFPFPAAIWITNTGENHSGVNFFGKPKMVTENITSSFNFEVSKDQASLITTVLYHYPYALVRYLLRSIKRSLKKN